ncbi:Energy-coupling factor transporter ATP-binding protein EcfA2 [Neomoorella glycerini]|uniref:Energy-coupling factor transporter ATP-binding protein EcfA2 n=1 Tax=Neomoorella glycerini TaxID=55779 RepID=A0A6I5ZPT6_9FIRM|nr:energy-coupling factor transporter ATPase [Moorella glycerini]QGP91808.1 Energy-coupling factor transporter ATP-binding protein EcfA2 [Moorella glycerini]
MEIGLQEVSFAYQVAGRQLPVLENITLRVSPGDFLAVTGAGGSGKSTLAMLMAGLLEPTAGRVTLHGQPARGRGKGKGLSPWQRVGMVFQQPEQQLFAETVAEDVAFGPRNLGLGGARLEARVKAALRAVGLDPQAVGGRSPFTLSGGQQRRVAIAGILAMEPEVLILDEPTAGLDPAGREQVLNVVRAFYRRPGKAVVLISHNMVEVAELAREVIVLHQGRVALQGTPRDIFRQGEALRSYGLIPPPLTSLMQVLRRRGAPVPLDVLTLAEARDAILAWLGV